MRLLRQKTKEPRGETIEVIKGRAGQSSTVHTADELLGGRIRHAPELGGDYFIACPSDEYTVFHASDLQLSSADSANTAQAAVDPADEMILRLGLGDEIRRLAEIAQAVAPATSIRVGFDEDAEDGETGLLVEVHYAALPVEELVERHDRLVSRFVRELSADARRHLTLVPMPAADGG